MRWTVYLVTDPRELIAHRVALGHTSTIDRLMQVAQALHTVQALMG